MEKRIVLTYSGKEVRSEVRWCLVSAAPSLNDAMRTWQRQSLARETGKTQTLQQPLGPASRHQGTQGTFELAVQAGLASSHCETWKLKSSLWAGDAFVS